MTSEPLGEGQWTDEEWEAEMARHYAEYQRATPLERAIVTGRPTTWHCPFCGKDYGQHPDPSPAAIACCGEIGHLEQIVLEAA
jgi:hypothetical protein